MKRLAIVAFALLVLTPVGSDAGDPRNKSECLIALAGALETRPCGRLGDGMPENLCRRRANIHARAVPGRRRAPVGTGL